ncbi:MAG: peptide chain release factor 1 [Anaerolineae bacterium]|uniref:peptide chain release factor 1 n=1 Tax=Promineifilum sp. TaxID=2664178 RepID=UPI001D7F3613|nr:peptide chain release factor 1 [Anaerolineales bacterium]MCB8935361.1 peptide chain release factor 1 [Promineifilum sp.]MCO5181974.1 peptide chain release factor 1 [Promineifilum sp.]MCW5846532.1 peptide chain release factor 1 [Anaerolineae bacterium]
MTNLFDKLDKVVDHYNEIERQMAEPEVLADHTRLTELAQERMDLNELVETYQQYTQLRQELAQAEEMSAAEEDEEMAALAADEIERLATQLERLESRMRSLLIPKDPRDDKNVFIEIRAGTGGDEAGIFAGDLLRMYMRYAEARRWKAEIVDENETGVGGYKEVILAVKGRGAYSRLKYESGVHRVQRVPQTESQGRIHTSAATVAVMPELDPVDITLDEKELVITAEFSSGPGGQHMQKNATAARVVHKPTGMFVKIQSERSLSQNKQLAMAIIQARLEEMEQEKQSSAEAANRKAQVGSGDRSEKIRTYNYPQSRVTDHRVGFTSYNLPVVMDGDLDPFIDALILADEAEKLAAATE